MRGRIVVIWAAVLIAAFSALVVPARAGGSYGIVVRRNVAVRLSDGRVLRADVHAPADPATGRVAAGRFPVIVGFTPYGKTAAARSGSPGFDGFNPYLVRRGYIAAVVDVPGTGASGGRFDLFGPAEARAGAEVVRWAAALPHGSGKVGMLGLSYVAIDQLFTAAAVGPGSPLKAIFPMAASADPYRDLFTSGGALNVVSPTGLLFGYGVTRVTSPFAELPADPGLAARLAYEHLLQAGPVELTTARDMLTNGPRRYDGAYWKIRAPERILPRIVANRVAVYLVGGLYDVFQSGEPLLYSGLQNAAAGRPVTAPMLPGQPVSSRYQLLYGPWTHHGMGQGIDLNRLQLQWFDRWLKGRDTPIAHTSAPLHIVEPGGSTYRTAAYPPAAARPVRLWLRSHGRLTAGRPASGEGGDGLIYRGLSDPCSRSTDQYTAGSLTDNLPGVCTGPRRRPLRTPGEVTYTTPAVHRALRLAGPIGVTLRATSTRPDALWALTLEDVAPDGTSVDITGGAQLGSLRAVDDARSWPGTSGTWIQPYHPLTVVSRRPVPVGTPVRYDIQVRPAFATVAAGHRLRLRIATADFPHLVPFADLPHLIGGRYTIRHDTTQPSAIELTVLS